MSKFDKVLMQTAENFATLSSCKRKQVGAVLVSEDYRILCCGYNGTISKHDNCCETEIRQNSIKCLRFVGGCVKKPFNKFRKLSSKPLHNSLQIFRQNRCKSLAV